MLAEGDKWTQKYLLSWGLFVYLSNLSTAAHYSFTFRKSCLIFLSLQSLNSYLFVSEINEQLIISFYILYEQLHFVYKTHITAVYLFCF